MPKESKKGNQINEQKEEAEEKAEGTKDIQKTSIQISTRVRDRLWRLKFRMTYEEFLWELCEMYEKSAESEHA